MNDTRQATTKHHKPGTVCIIRGMYYISEQ